MVTFAEINSFIGKFMYLWESGKDVDLQLKSHAGKACITLSLGLGDFPENHQYKKEYGKQNASPSQVKRRKAFSISEI